MKASKRLMKLLRLAAFALLLGLVAAGCGPNEDEVEVVPETTTPPVVDEVTPPVDEVTGGEELEVITGGEAEVVDVAGETGGETEEIGVEVTGGDTGGVETAPVDDVTGGETGGDAANTELGVIDEDATGGADEVAPLGETGGVTGGTGALPGETGDAEVAATTGLGANATAEEQVQAVGAVITNLAQAAEGQQSGASGGQ